MALTDYRLESLKGVGPIPVKQGIMEESATQKAPLGQRLEMNDGRVFHYALNGAVALNPGCLVTSKAAAANAANKNVLAASVGDYTVTVVSSAAITDAAEGYLCINDGTGQGQLLKIKQSAANATTATSTDCTLYDPVNVAIVASGTSEASIYYNPWDDVVVQASQTAFVCGVPIIPVQATYYFWCQTWGLASVLHSDASIIGTNLTTSDTVDGGIFEAAAASVTQTLGVQYSLVGVDTEYRVIFLKIAP